MHPVREDGWPKALQTGTFCARLPDALGILLRPLYPMPIKILNHGT